MTLNVLVPGGMVKSRMTATAQTIYTSGLFEPDIMVDPLLWLTSSAADGITGKRLIAAYWDNALPSALAWCFSPTFYPPMGGYVYPTTMPELAAKIGKLSSPVWRTLVSAVEPGDLVANRRAHGGDPENALLHRPSGGSGA